MADTIEALTRRRDRALARFATLGDLQPGSLVVNYRKCGRPNCHCARPGDRGHGPNYILARTLKGQHRSIPIRRHEAEDTRRQCDEYKRFREYCDAFLEASEALADAVRAKGREAAGENPEKGSTHDGNRKLKGHRPLDRRTRRRSGFRDS